MSFSQPSFLASASSSLTASSKLNLSTTRYATPSPNFTGTVDHSTTPARMIAYTVGASKESITLLKAPNSNHADKTAKLQAFLSVYLPSPTFSTAQRHPSKAADVSSKIIHFLRDIRNLQLLSVLDGNFANQSPVVVAHLRNASNPLPPNIQWIELCCSIPFTSISDLLNDFEFKSYTCSFFLRLPDSPPTLTHPSSTPSPNAYQSGYSSESDSDNSSHVLVHTTPPTVVVPLTLYTTTPSNLPILRADCNTPKLVAFASKHTSNRSFSGNFNFLHDQSVFDAYFTHWQPLLNPKSFSSKRVTDDTVTKNILNQAHFFAFTRFFYCDYISGDNFNIIQASNDTIHCIHDYVNKIRGSYFDHTSRQTIPLHPQTLFDEFNAAGTMLIHAEIRKISFNLYLSYYNNLAPTIRERMFLNQYSAPSSNSSRVIKQLSQMQRCRDAALLAYDSILDDEQRVKLILDRIATASTNHPHPTDDDHPSHDETNIQTHVNSHKETDEPYFISYEESHVNSN